MTNRQQISEAQLRSIVHNVIMEEAYRQGYINEAQLDEGFWSNLKSGFNTAFGQDIQNTKNKAVGAYNNAVQGTKEIPGNIRKGYNNMRQGMRDRADAYKQGSMLQQRNDDMTKAIELINKLIQNGTIHGGKTVEAAKYLVQCLNLAIRGNRGGMTMTRNNVGA